MELLGFWRGEPRGKLVLKSLFEFDRILKSMSCDLGFFVVEAGVMCHLRCATSPLISKFVGRLAHDVFL